MKSNQLSTKQPQKQVKADACTRAYRDWPQIVCHSAGSRTDEPISQRLWLLPSHCHSLLLSYPHPLRHRRRHHHYRLLQLQPLPPLLFRRLAVLHWRVRPNDASDATVFETIWNSRGGCRHAVSPHPCELVHAISEHKRWRSVWYSRHADTPVVDRSVRYRARCVSVRVHSEVYGLQTRDCNPQTNTLNCDWISIHALRAMLHHTPHDTLSFQNRKYPTAIQQNRTSNSWYVQFVVSDKT